MDPRGDEIQPGRGPGPQDIGAAPPPAAPPVGEAPDDTAVGATPSRGHMFLFYASFLTLIAGGIGFAVRGSLLGAWGQQYGFTQFELGQITGAGLWGFPIAIIPLSFVVDKWGYGRVMAIAFALHVLSAVVTLAATPVYFAVGGNKEAAYWCLYLGSFIFSLANGACESVINPLTATLFPRAKTHWLNILHAGWPGGLILGALIALGFNYLGDAVGHIPWEYSMGHLPHPGADLRRHDVRPQLPTLRGAAGGRLDGRHAAGIRLPDPAVLDPASCDGRLRRAGHRQLDHQHHRDHPDQRQLRSYAVHLDLGPDVHPALLAGPIVHKISPLGLLFCAAVLGCIGLLLLGQVFDSLGSSLNVLWFLLLAATVYGCGKTFFWPTMLGVVSERFPKGGALTLGVVGGIGMLSVGLLGNPIIGYEQDYFAKQSLESSSNAAYARYSAATKDSYLFLPEISGLDNTKVGTLLGDPGKDNGDGKKLATDIQNPEGQEGGPRQVPGAKEARQLVAGRLHPRALYGANGHPGIGKQRGQAAGPVLRQPRHGAGQGRPAARRQNGAELDRGRAGVHGAGLPDPDHLFLEPRRLPGPGAPRTPGQRRGVHRRRGGSGGYVA